MKSFLLVFVIIFAVFEVDADDAAKIRPIFCIDGDSFIAAPDSQVYRLWGVDAPELDQRWGEAARAALTALIHKKHLETEVHGYSYKRPVVEAKVRGLDVGLEMLKMGLAWYCPEYAPKRDDYKKAMEEAKSAGRGLWSDPNPENPADFRKNRTE